MFTIKDWNIEAVTGYKPIGTFFTDFSIADNYGPDAVKDTYKRALRDWKSNYKMLTELVMALNWKCWQHYDEDNQQLSAVYSDLYYQADDYATSHLKGEELKYYYQTTD